MDLRNLDVLEWTLRLFVMSSAVNTHALEYAECPCLRWSRWSVWMLVATRRAIRRRRKRARGRVFECW